MGSPRVTIGANNSAFSKAMNEMSRQLKMVKSDFSVVEAEAKLMGDETQVLNAKQQSLTETMKIQSNMIEIQDTKVKTIIQQLKKQEQEQSSLENKINETNEAYKKSVQETGKESEASKKLHDELVKLKEEYAKNEKSIETSNKALDNAKIKQNNLQKELIKSKQELKNVEEQLSKVPKALDNLPDKKNLSILDVIKELTEKSKGNGLGGIVEQFSAFKGAISEGGASIGSFVTSIGTLGASFGPVGIGIAGVVAGFKALSGVGSWINELSEASNTLKTKTGETGTAFKDLQNIMNNIYSNNFGESYEEIASTLSDIKNMTNLSGQELQNVTQYAYLLRDSFDVDINESVRASRILMKSFGIDAEQSFNLMTQGIQNGLDFSGEMIDTINEYAPQFSKAGLSAQDMFNMLKNGSDAGAWNLDKVGDAVKELGVRLVDGSDTTKQGLEQLGLSSDEIRAKIIAGGDSAREATLSIFEGLSNCENKVVQNNAGLNLFGTMWEDLDASTVQALGNINGNIDITKDSINQLMETKYSTFSDGLEGVGRSIKGAFAPLGEACIPILESITDVLRNTVTPAFQSFSSFLTNNIGNIKDVFSIVFGAIKISVSAILSPITLAIKAVTGLRNTISNFGGVSNIFSSALNGIKSAASKVFNVGSWSQLGSYVIQGLRNGISNGVSSIIAKVKNIAASISKTFRSIMRIHSPSKVMEENGVYVSEGVSIGIQKGTDDVKKATEKMAEEIENNISVNTDKFQRFCDGVVNAIKARYEKEEDIQLKSLEKQLTEEENASDERLAIYEKEYNEKVKLFEQETDEKTTALQAQIDAIEAEQEAEDKAKETREYNEKIAGLKEKLALAETEEEKEEIRKDIASAKLDREEKLKKEERQRQKEELKEQINKVKEEASTQKEALKESYELQKEEEKKSIELTKENNKAQQEEVKNHYAELLSQDNLNAEARKLIQSENQEEILALLESYNPKWQDSGQSLADSLLNGLNSEKQSIQDAISEAVTLDELIPEQQSKLAELKAQIEAMNEAESSSSSAGGGDSGGSGGGEDSFDDMGLGGGGEDSLSDLGMTEDNLGIEALAEEEQQSEGFVQKFKDFISQKKEEIHQGASTFFTITIPGLWTSFTSWIQSIPSSIGTFLSTKWNELTTWASTSINGLLTNIHTWVSDLPFKAGQLVGTILQTFYEWGTNAKNFFTTTIPDMVNSIGQWFSELPGKVKTWFDNTINDIKTWGSNTVSYLSTEIPNLISSVGQWFSELPSKISSGLSSAWNNLKEWCTNMVSSGKEGASNTISGIIETFSSLPSKMIDVGKNIVSGLKNGIMNAWSDLKSSIGSMCSDFIDGVKSKFEIHSPSRVMRDEVGVFIAEGIGEGFSGGMISVNKDASKTLDTTINSLRSSADIADIYNKSRIQFNVENGEGAKSNNNSTSSSKSGDFIQYITFKSDDISAKENAKRMKKAARELLLEI